MKKMFTAMTVCILAAGCCGKTPKDGGPETLLLKDYAPVSVFNVKKTVVEKARYPVIDAHSHDYAKTVEEVRKWVATMDEAGVEVTHLLSCSWIGEPLEKMMERYSEFPDRFRFWCSFDYTDLGKPDWEERALSSLEKYHALGAVGVGEMGDKGMGDLYGYPVPGPGIHLDNPRLKVLLEKCGELGMPINIHVAEPVWMYEPMDATNDGLMNGYTWRVDTSEKGCLGYDALMDSFENAVKANPGTVFIACHYLNMSHDLPRLSAMLDRYPNMYLDIAARVSESAATPRATREFIIRYADRILFGTDNGMGAEMYRSIYRILETDDEHIIEDDRYRWPLSGFHLPDDVLQKLYGGNAEKLFHG